MCRQESWQKSKGTIIFVWRWLFFALPTQKMQHLLSASGQILAMTAKQWDQALANTHQLVDCVPLNVPGLVGERHIVRIKWR